MRRIPVGPLLAACCTLALMLVAVSVGGGRDGAAPTDASELPAAPDTTLADADATAAAIAAALPEAAPASVLEETDASSPVTEDGEVPGGPPRWAVADLQRSLATHVQQHGGAIVAGVAVANGPRETLVAGSDPDDELGPDSVFELGGLTKVYTATLLADMVVGGDVSLDDPVTRYLPRRVHVPRSGSREITLGDLATHTSGLQSNPTVVRSPDPDRPLAELTDVEQLYRMVSGYRLPREVGAEVHDSNAGYGLLGVALARRAGRSYDRLLRRRVLAPLGLDRTATARARNDGAHVVAGRDGDGAEVPPFATPAFPGAGDLRADVEDVLDFAEASIAKTGPLSPALARAQAPYRDHVGLGWRMVEAEALPLFVAGGTTTGFSSAIALDPTRGLAVAVLANTAGVDLVDVALHALAPSWVARWPSREVPSPAAVPIELLQPYMGTYAMPDVDLTLATTGGGNGLVARVDGGDPIPLVPTGPDGLMVADGDSTITFDRDEDGTVRGLVLHQLGEDIAGTRVPDA